MKKILVLEDEAGIRSFVVINLRRSGYEPVEAATGEEALRLLSEHDDIGLALLDVMLPDIDGFEICRSIRASGSKMGIIMLTALGQEMDKVTGLMTGADDYVTKPFSPAELLARVDALYRRLGSVEEDEEPELESGPFVLNSRNRTLDKNGQRVKLTQTEYSIMKLFMENPGKALSREDILESVWGADDKNKPGLAARALAAVKRFAGGERPETLKGLKGVWLIASCAGVVCVLLTLVMGLCGEAGWAGIFAGCAVALLLFSNLWFRERVTSPILGLGDTARRIADGSYGSLAEKLRDDEIGRFVDAFNDMSVKIGEAGRTQSEFISSVSHELRTPLTAITGWSETLMFDEAIQGDSRRGVEIISAEAGRLTGMVEELLEFTRLRDGRFTLNLEEVELELLLEEVAFTYGELLKHDGLELIYETPEEPLLPVTGDPARLKQVLLNILDNAAKYGKRGKRIELSAKNEGEYVKVMVRDHGPGFADEDLPHVKERFYKGRGKERGSGIGLAVCDEIVTRHRGRLTVGNCEDGGGLVTVELPVKTQ